MTHAVNHRFTSGQICHPSFLCGPLYSVRRQFSVFILREHLVEALFTHDRNSILAATVRRITLSQRGFKALIHALLPSLVGDIPVSV